jgi:hypothetical protein
MRSITSPRRSRRNAGQQPEPSLQPSRQTNPCKKDRHGRGAAIPLSIPSIILAIANAAAANPTNAAAVAAANPRIPFIAQAAVKAAEAAAVAAANHCASIEFSFAPLGNVLEPVSSTLPAGAAAFSADIMSTAGLAPTAEFALPEALAVDVSVPPAAAYSTLGVTNAARSEAVSADVTVATAASANLSTAEAVATDLTVPVNTTARAEASPADVTVATVAFTNLSTAEAAGADLPVPVDSTARAEAASADVTVATAASTNLSTAEAAAANLHVPVNPAASSSARMAIAEAAAGDVCFKNAASANLASAEAVVADLRGECVWLILHQFIYDMN